MTAIVSHHPLLSENPPPGTVLTLKEYPQSWYLVGQSSDIPAGRIHSCNLLGHPIVLFRTRNGKLNALAAHCAHMGTYLGTGTVVNDCLRCPLHHWSFDGKGRCRTPVQAQGQRAFPVREHLGCVFVFFGDEPLFDLPGFDAAAPETLRTSVGRRVTIECPWIAIPSNAYDIQHLNAVHGRALREPPELRLLDPYRLRLRYVSRVTGYGLSDRAMKYLANDHIHVSITCWGGTIFTVESHVGKRNSMLLLGIMPTATGAEITPIFAMKRTGVPPLDALRVSVAGWLFTRFLTKDVAGMRGMRFKPPETLLDVEQTLHRFLAYLDALPAAPGGFPRSTREALCPLE